MTIETLTEINDILDNLIPYEFGEWTDTVQFPFWTGEYSEISPMSEDGEEDTTFIITGTTKGSYYQLEQHKALIENAFPKIGGYVKTLDSGNCIRIFFETAFPVPVDDNNMKRMQINLLIKEWKVT